MPDVKNMSCNIDLILTLHYLLVFFWSILIIVIEIWLLSPREKSMNGSDRGCGKSDSSDSEFCELLTYGIL